MAIAEQFAGLQMDQLIGAPLRAAVDASLQLADSTADFIRRAGFDGMGKVRTVSFGYQRYSANEDGTSNREEMEVAVPLLAVTPIPNLQVDEVNLLFDIEVKQSERIESSIELNAAANLELLKWALQAASVRIRRIQEARTILQNIMWISGRSIMECLKGWPECWI